MNIKFTVEVKDGDVYIDGNYFRQLCWDAESVGYAIMAFLNDEKPDNED